VPENRFRRLPLDPGNEFSYLRMLSDRFGGGKIRVQFFVSEQGVQLAVAGAVQVSARFASLGFWPPVVPIHTLTGQHLPPANRAGTEFPGLFFKVDIRLFLHGPKFGRFRSVSVFLHLPLPSSPGL